MDKSWFHQCLTGILSLSVISKKDVDGFLVRHPYQANMRLIQGFMGNDHPHPDHKAEPAFYLPDRKALFRGFDSPLPTEANRKSAIQVVPPSSVEDLPTVRKSGTLPLPVYAPPAVDTEEMEPDNEDASLDDLEAILLARWEEEDSRTSSTSSEGPAEEPGFAAPGQNRKPVMERFDMALRQEGDHPDQEPVQQDFVDWLQTLQAPSVSSLTTNDAPDEGIRDAVHSKSSRPDTDGPGKKGKGGKENKKKRKKKEARKLARKSLRPSQEIASETLAALLARQGHTDQAIVMYERLTLLHPEKKAIFAGQIAKLKRKDP